VTKRQKGEGHREYRAEEVDALTARANTLLDELHEVMGEMTERLRILLGDEKP
jgi:hypothetical protein